MATRASFTVPSQTGTPGARQSQGRSIPSPGAQEPAPAPSQAAPQPAPAPAQSEPAPQQDSQPMNEVLRQLFNR